MKVEEFKLFEGNDEVTLTSYILDTSEEMCGDMPRPAVIVCPGGGYFSCSDREGEPVALNFAKMGYHAFVLRYSVACNKGDNPFARDLSKIEPDPKKIHPQPMRDIAKAFEFIDKHAFEWHVDIKRIAICGFSAGGHNCAMYATHWNKPVIKEYIGDDSVNLRPAACILGYPLTDYIYMKESAMKDPGAKEFFTASNRAFMGDDWDNEEKLLDVSPARLVDENTPPTFIWTTSKDNMVPNQHSALYAFALAEAGIPYELHVFQDGFHGLATGDRLSASAKSQYDSNVNKWLSLCDAWLAKYFEFDLPKITVWEQMQR